MSAPGQCWGGQDRQERRGEDLPWARWGEVGVGRLPEHPSASCQLPGVQLPALLLTSSASSVSKGHHQCPLNALRRGWGCCKGTPWGPLLLLVENPVGITPESSLCRAGPSQPGKWDAGAAVLGPLSTGCSYFGCRVYRLRNAAGGRCLRVTPGPSGPRLRAGPAERGWERRGQAETPPRLLCWGGAVFRQPR